MAQASLEQLGAVQKSASIDYATPKIDLSFDLPPGSFMSSLTLYAAPGRVAPATDSALVISVNDYAGIVLTPRPQDFMARMDLPAGQLRAGRNTVAISFEGPPARQCPWREDGGWVIDLRRSRLDLAGGTQVADFAGLETWLAADLGGPGSVQINGDILTPAARAAFGALIVQGVSLRARHVPHLAKRGDFLVSAQKNPRAVGPSLKILPGPVPQLVLLGRDETQIVAAARLFAARILDIPGTVAAAPDLAHAPLLRKANPLSGLPAALQTPFWRGQPYVTDFRAPRAGQLRLLLDIERTGAEGVSTLVRLNGEAAARKKLRRKVNHVRINLDGSGGSVQRRLAIGRVLEGPSGRAPACAQGDRAAPLRLLRARIESNGFAHLGGLSRFSVDAAPFANGQGADTSIRLPANSHAALMAGWQVLGRLALNSGRAWTDADYGVIGGPGHAALRKNLLLIGPRAQLKNGVADLALNPVFAQGAASGPDGKAGRKFHLIPAARAAENPLPGLGVATWAPRPGGGMAVVLTGETTADFIPAMDALAMDTALDRLDGRVARWRHDRVAVNVVDPPVFARDPRGAARRKKGFWLIMGMAALTLLSLLMARIAFERLK